MELTPVSSTNLHAIGYDPSINELQIQFQNGDVYAYQNVSPELYFRLINGDAGQIFVDEIKPARYAMPFTKLGNMPFF